MQDWQTTIKQPVTLSGPSLITQKKCLALILPAAADTGIIFKIGSVIIPANFKYIDHTSPHTTNLVKDNLTIKTVEHFLAALWGLDIDNAIIELSASGLPFMDFSAEFYTSALLPAGLQQLNQPRSYLTITKSFRITPDNDDCLAIIEPPINNDLTIETIVKFPGLIGFSTAKFSSNKNNFAKEISWSRSFMRSPLNDDGSKWQRVRSIYPLLPEDPRQSPLIVYAENSFFTPLKAKNEPARHKILDFLGDTALLGQRIKANIVIYKPGHHFNYFIIDHLNKYLAQSLEKTKITYPLIIQKITTEQAFA